MDYDHYCRGRGYSSTAGDRCAGYARHVATGAAEYFKDGCSQDLQSSGWAYFSMHGNRMNCRTHVPRVTFCPPAWGSWCSNWKEKQIGTGLFYNDQSYTKDACYYLCSKTPGCATFWWRGNAGTCALFREGCEPSTELPREGEIFHMSNCQTYGVLPQLIGKADIVPHFALKTAFSAGATDGHNSQYANLNFPERALFRPEFFVGAAEQGDSRDCCFDYACIKIVPTSPGGQSWWEAEFADKGYHLVTGFMIFKHEGWQDACANGFNNNQANAIRLYGLASDNVTPELEMRPGPPSIQTGGSWISISKHVNKLRLEVTQARLCFCGIWIYEDRTNTITTTPGATPSPGPGPGPGGPSPGPGPAPATTTTTTTTTTTEESVAEGELLAPNLISELAMTSSGSFFKHDQTLFGRSGNLNAHRDGKEALYSEEFTLDLQINDHYVPIRALRSSGGSCAGILEAGGGLDGRFSCGGVGVTADYFFPNFLVEESRHFFNLEMGIILNKIDSTNARIHLQHLKDDGSTEWAAIYFDRTKKFGVANSFFGSQTLGGSSTAAKNAPSDTRLGKFNYFRLLKVGTKVHLFFNGEEKFGGPYTAPGRFTYLQLKGDRAIFTLPVLHATVDSRMLESDWNSGHPAVINFFLQRNNSWLPDPTLHYGEQLAQERRYAKHVADGGLAGDRGAAAAPGDEKEDLWRRKLWAGFFEEKVHRHSTDAFFPGKFGTVESFTLPGEKKLISRVLFQPGLLKPKQFSAQGGSAAASKVAETDAGFFASDVVARRIKKTGAKGARLGSQKVDKITTPIVLSEYGSAGITDEFVPLIPRYEAIDDPVSIARAEEAGEEAERNALLDYSYDRSNEVALHDFQMLELSNQNTFASEGYGYYGDPARNMLQDRLCYPPSVMVDPVFEVLPRGGLTMRQNAESEHRRLYTATAGLVRPYPYQVKPHETTGVEGFEDAHYTDPKPADLEMFGNDGKYFRGLKWDLVWASDHAAQFRSRMSTASGGAATGGASAAGATSGPRGGADFGLVVRLLQARKQRPVVGSYVKDEQGTSTTLEAQVAATPPEDRRFVSYGGGPARHGKPADFRKKDYYVLSETVIPFYEPSSSQSLAHDPAANAGHGRRWRSQIDLWPKCGKSVLALRDLMLQQTLTKTLVHPETRVYYQVGYRIPKHLRLDIQKLTVYGVYYAPSAVPHISESTTGGRIATATGTGGPAHDSFTASSTSRITSEYMVSGVHGQSCHRTCMLANGRVCNPLVPVSDYDSDTKMTDDLHSEMGITASSVCGSDISAEDTLINTVGTGNKPGSPKIMRGSTHSGALKCVRTSEPTASFAFPHGGCAVVQRNVPAATSNHIYAGYPICYCEGLSNSFSHTTKATSDPYTRALRFLSGAPVVPKADLTERFFLTRMLKFQPTANMISPDPVLVQKYQSFHKNWILAANSVAAGGQAAVDATHATRYENCNDVCARQSMSLYGVKNRRKCNGNELAKILQRRHIEAVLRQVLADRDFECQADDTMPTPTIGSKLTCGLYDQLNAASENFFDESKGNGEWTGTGSCTWRGDSFHRVLCYCEDVDFFDHPEDTPLSLPDAVLYDQGTWHLAPNLHEPTREQYRLQELRHLHHCELLEHVRHTHGAVLLQKA
ncbi:unnamed protein product [Amoebophrya sp. A120]|nr:unnamed protein product [Amoebophrya sp. A120]|eukprot:GSA120T00013998001.1